MRILLFTLLLLAGGRMLHADTPFSKLDSLSKQLSETKTDSAKVRIMISMITETQYSNPGEAYSIARKMLGLDLRSTSKKMLASAYNTTSIVCRQIGDFDKAIELGYKSLSLYEGLNDTANQAGCYLNISTAFKAKSEFPKALELLNQALGFFEKIKNKKGIAYAYNNMATIYREQGKPEEALGYFQKSLSYKMALKDKRGMAGAYMNIGIALQDLKKYDSAVISYRKALGMNRDLNSRIGIADVYTNLGDLNTETGNYKLAKIMLDSAMLLASQMSEMETLEGVYRATWKLYNHTGEEEKALNYFDKYLVLKDSTLNESSAKQVAEMGVRYDTEKKDKLIELQKKKAEIDLLKIKKDKLLIGGLIAGFSGLLLLSFLLYNRFRFRKQVNASLSVVNTQINEQKKEITDSIYYARRIQDSILLRPDKIQEMLPRSFLLYKPKQIVSGDFYWAGKTGDEVIVAVFDNALHGVPGAFISLVGINLLNRAIQDEEIHDLKPLISYMSEGILATLKQVRNSEDAFAGFKYSVCKINTVTSQMECISAGTSIYTIGDSGVQELKGGSNEEPAFHKATLNKTDLVYLFTDGYVNQLGGTDGKKFMIKKLEETILSFSNQPLPSQRQNLEEVLVNWQGGLQQEDDIVVLGFGV